MSDDAARQTSRDRALNVVRGYANHDGIAVRDALDGLDGVEGLDGLDGLDAGSSIEVYAILNGLLRSTISIMELTGKAWKLDDLVRQADEVAVAAPPHYEFAVGEATQAWARGDQSAMRAVSCQDVVGAVHITAVGVAVLGRAVWGRTGFLDVLQEFHDVATALAHDRPSGV
ncbi:hypothetical protein [Streptomyces soliscabiei]|uniref:hypothetical protein n=1 Tax=Streptomyces soliscabiei TaxID=588897 RepID=UPI0029AEFCA4|nr:hypothetical protein [Streptomyces sp. NY05-11A]MDX2681358.1 hypothetical protein [Streptomyces sp. NY05-11A]